ncbi:MAG TPA: hypothetical protein VJR49_00400 [Chthoniobacterales bacterium]|nr:hypothetical protein [Chthoniobacterales bacterium]
MTEQSEYFGEGAETGTRERVRSRMNNPFELYHHAVLLRMMLSLRSNGN